MIVHSHYPVGEPRVEREAQAAVDAGYAVDVISLRLPHEMPSETIDGVSVTRLPVQHVRGASATRSVFEYLGFAIRATIAVLKLQRQGKIDVVHVHAPPDFLIAAAVIPRFLGSGVVLDIHDLSPDMFDIRYRRIRFAGLAERILRLIERLACRIANRVVTVHAPYRDELSAHGVPLEKIVVVMNAPPEEALRRARDAAVDHDESFLVAYHGTVNHWYGVDLVVEAIGFLEKDIPRLQGVILGEGDALASVQTLAARLGVERLIRFSGVYLPYSEALARIAAASCGVIPNRYSRLNRFALSSKLLEYVALGIPVVVAELETLAAHFASEEVTFFQPGDPLSLAEAIAWVAGHPVEAHEKAQRAQQRAVDYAWPINRTRLLEAISYAAS